MDIICEHNKCTGCQACKFSCPTESITMQEDANGFYYPAVNQYSCIDCGKCRKVCPAISNDVVFREPLIIYAGWTKNSKIRHYSTSGGAAYEISKSVIETGGIVCGCRWKVDHAEHSFAHTIEELRQFQGSKYAYSDLGGCFLKIKEYLNLGQIVLFIGTGCQVAGLKAYLGKTYDSLLTVDVLCHGIPSQKALHERIRSVEEEKGMSVVDMRFRDKREDLLHTYCKYTYKDGSSYYCSVYRDPFFRGFVTNYLLRPNCFSCKFAQDKRVSDITIADFWGYTPKSFRFINHNQGVSLIIVNTQKGQSIVNSLDSFKKEEREYFYAKLGNRNLNGPQMKPKEYDVFWERYLSGESLQQLSDVFFPKQSVPPVKKREWKIYLKVLIGEKKLATIKSFIRKNLRWAYGPFLDARRMRKKNECELRQFGVFKELKPGRDRVFYFGITKHSNLGDLAQRYCITNWIKENYPMHELVMVESDVIVNRNITSQFFAHLKEIYGKNDIIVFQSGYCTQDLGGNHPLMHRLVCDNMPNAKILMMPQTIYFQNEDNKRVCAENHNKAKNMLFLARDNVSYKMAKEMFPDIRVLAYPDIVTTLIGTIKFDSLRDGVCLCTRDDGEKYYSKEEIDSLATLFFEKGIRVVQKDTQAQHSVDDLLRNLAGYVESEIESYSHFNVTITDRYHGTIFSLCAGTPVIILKTTDHKVITGADWFKGVYDEYVYLAEDLEDAYRIATDIMHKEFSHIMQPYFKTVYYDKLKACFDS